MNNESGVPDYYIPLGSSLKNKYKITGYLGEGGFGITYKGMNTTLEMPVAIKEFYPAGYASRYSTAALDVTFSKAENHDIYTKWKKRFLDEAKTLARFSALPGIVSVHDFFEDHGTAYIIMEFIDGITLKAYVKRNGRFQARDICDKMIPLLGSLDKIHKAGLIHRDISPDNIMILPDGTLKLFDFGAARDYEYADNKGLSVIMKPGYAPEEQYRSRGQQGPFIDVYALCATLYFCITGTPPEESTQRAYEDDLKPISEFAYVPEYIESAVTKGMSIRAQDRFQSAAELAVALGAVNYSNINNSNTYGSATQSASTNTRTQFMADSGERTQSDTTDKGHTEYVFDDRTEVRTSSGDRTEFIADFSGKTVSDAHTNVKDESMHSANSVTPIKNSSGNKKPIIIAASIAAAVVIGIGAAIIALNSGSNDIQTSNYDLNVTAESAATATTTIAPVTTTATAAPVTTTTKATTTAAPVTTTTKETTTTTTTTITTKATTTAAPVTTTTTQATTTAAKGPEYVEDMPWTIKVDGGEAVGGGTVEGYYWGLWDNKPIWDDNNYGHFEGRYKSDGMIVDYFYNGDWKNGKPYNHREEWYVQPYEENYGENSGLALAKDYGYCEVYIFVGSEGYEFEGTFLKKGAKIVKRGQYSYSDGCLIGPGDIRWEYPDGDGSVSKSFNVIFKNDGGYTF